MPRSKRTSVRVVGDRETLSIAATLGRQVRETRARLGVTQVELGTRVGVGPTRIAQIEDGHGRGAPLTLWVAIGLAIGRPIGVAFSRSISADAPADAGHLAIQEHLLRMARATGRAATFELATRPTEPTRSVDVGVRDDANRVLILEEAWNTFGDVGAARRSTARKVAEAEGVAVALGHGRPYRVAAVWVVRATAANRELVRRYPEVFANACPGSSRRWVEALTTAAVAPDQPGLVWVDAASGRLTAWRRRGVD